MHLGLVRPDVIPWTRPCARSVAVIATAVVEEDLVVHHGIGVAVRSARLPGLLVPARFNVQHVPRANATTANLIARNV